MSHGKNKGRKSKGMSNAGLFRTSMTDLLWAVCDGRPGDLGPKARQKIAKARKRRNRKSGLGGDR